MNYSTPIAQAIRHKLTQLGPSLVAYNEKLGTFGYVASIPGQVGFAQYVIDVYSDYYVVLLRCPLRADPEDPASLSAAAEFINRINCDLRHGNFVLDYNTGEIRYKLVVECGRLIPTDDRIEESLMIPARMLRLYAPGLINVLFRNTAPADAVDQCEAPVKTQVRIPSLARRMLDEILRKRHTRQSVREEEKEEPPEVCPSWSLEELDDDEELYF